MRIIQDCMLVGGVGPFPLTEVDRFGGREKMKKGESICRKMIFPDRKKF